MTPVRQHAAIRINKRCYKYTKKKFETTLIHEMLHPLFDPIQKEHERTEQFLLKNKHFDEAVEVAVDHIAKVLYNLSQ